VTTDPSAFTAGVFDRAAQTYDNVGVPYFRPIARLLVDSVALQAGERVLDIGCGRGAVTRYAAEEVGPAGRVTAIDLSPVMVDYTRQDVERRRFHHVTVDVADGQAIELRDASYDAVLSSLSVFFLPDPREAFIRYRRALRPGGRFGFTTFAGDDPRWGWLDEMRRKFLPGQPVDPPGYAQFENDAVIAELLAAAGFRDVMSHTRLLDVEFRDEEHWWTWTWSQGMRAFWEQLDETALAGAHTFAMHKVHEMATPNGSILLRQPIRLTTAVAP
jgi:ubiquinone/menaquinone biosynthesis C-methylase UbiE